MNRRRRLASVLAALLAAAAPLVGGATPATAATPVPFEVVHPLVQVQPESTQVQVQGAPSADFWASMNELESFQVVLFGGATGLSNVQLSVSGALTGPNGWSIPAENISLYRADYYSLYHPSDGEWYGNGVSACVEASMDCRFADALLPKFNPYTATPNTQALPNAFPLSVPANENRVVWVDVQIPGDGDGDATFGEGKNIGPGTYTGNLAIAATGFTTTPLPMTVEVVNFDQPSTPSLAGGVGWSTGGCAAAHAGSCPDTLWELYLRASMNNRFPLTRPTASNPNAANPTSFTTYALPYLNGTSGKTLLPGQRLPTVKFESYEPTAGPTGYDQQFADDWKKVLAANGLNGRITWYCDELGANATKWGSCESGYDSARSLWDAASVAPNPDPGPLDVALTGNLAALSYGQGLANHDAADNVRTLVPTVGQMHPAGGASNRSAYDAWLGLGDGRRLWLYNSCDSNTCHPGADENDYTTVEWAGAQGWPSYVIDQPGTQARAMGWQDFLYNVTGDYYYQSFARLSQAWDPCPAVNTTGVPQCQYFSGGNGDGTLFYPGTPARTGLPNGTDIPIESIRLKRIRDGREDYELLRHLRTLGGAADPTTLAKALFPEMAQSNVVDRLTSYPAQQYTAASTFESTRRQIMGLLPAPAVPSGPVELAWVSNAGGDWEIWTGAVDGSGATQITTNTVDDRFPSWSPDGTRLAFTRGTGATADIWIMNADGSGAVAFAANSGVAKDEKPRWSPDGKRITWVSSRNGTGDDVWVADANGANPRRMTVTAANEYDPTFSPEGSRLLYSQGPPSSSDLRAISLSGELSGSVTALLGAEDLPAWPAGGYLYFDSTDGGDYDIVRKPTIAVSITNLTGTSAANDFGPSPSPTVDRIAFASDRTGGDLDLYVMNADGTSVVPVTADTGVDQRDVAWRPALPGVTFTVTRATDAVDTNPGDGICATVPSGCSLRAAVQEANARTGRDRIILPAGAHMLSIAGADEDASATGDLDLVGPVELVGAGPETTVINAGGLDGGLSLSGTEVTIEGLTVTNGTAFGISTGAGRTFLRSCAATTTVGPAPVGSPIGVAGIVAGGATWIDQCQVSGSAGAGIAAMFPENLVVSRSTVAGNAGPGIDNFNYQEILYNQLVADSTIHGNGGTGVYVEGAGYVVNSTVTGNGAGVVAGVETNEARRSVLAANGDGVGCGLSGTNWVWESSCVGSDPKLGPLQPTASSFLPVRLPASDSPLVDALGANCPGALPQSRDELSQARPVDGNGAGGAQCDPGAVERPAPLSGSGFVGITPTRVLDSRIGTGFVGPIGPGASKAVTIAGAGGSGVPAGATAVVLNVTVTQGTASSYLTAYPTGTAAPTAANLLFAPGQTVPNHVTVQVGTGGQVSYFNQLGSVHVIADVLGYYTDTGGDRFNAITPTRFLDSRGSVGGWGGTPLGTVARDLQVTNVLGVPSSATAVVMNVTATGGTAASVLAVRPKDGSAGPTANLLFAAGQTVPNLVTVKVGTGGNVTFTNQSGSVHVIADVVGYFDPSTGGRFHPVAPTRIVDSRTGTGFTGPVAAGGTASFAGGVAGQTGLVANVTVTQGTAPSFLTVFPGGQSLPGTANLLFAGGQTVPNAVTVGLSASGVAQVFNQAGTVHVIVDKAGYYAP